MDHSVYNFDPPTPLKQLKVPCHAVPLFLSTKAHTEILKMKKTTTFDASQHLNTCDNSGEIHENGENKEKTSKTQQQTSDLNSAKKIDKKKKLLRKKRRSLRRKKMEHALRDVIDASQNLTNLRQLYSASDRDLSYVSGLCEPDQNSEIHEISKQSRSRSREQEGEDHAALGSGVNENNQGDEDKISKKSAVLEDDDVTGDADEDGVFNWPKEKLISDRELEIALKEAIDEHSGPFDELHADENSSLSSISLSDIFFLCEEPQDSFSKLPSNRSLSAIFEDDNRFIMKDGLIVFEESRTKHNDPYINEYMNNESIRSTTSKTDREINGKAAGVLSWVGGGLNRLVKGDYQQSTNLNDTQHGFETNEGKLDKLKQPKYALYVGKPPMINRPSSSNVKKKEIFDARPPPVDEVILDARKGEIPELILNHSESDQLEQSFGMAQLRRLRRMRNGII